MKPKMEWKTDADGDHQLDVDGEYFGMVCPHHLPDYALCVWDWGQNQWPEPTVEAAKRHLERVARLAAKVAEFEAEEWDRMIVEDET